MYVINPLITNLSSFKNGGIEVQKCLVNCSVSQTSRPKSSYKLDIDEFNFCFCDKTVLN